MIAESALRSSALNGVFALRRSSLEFPNLDVHEIADHLRRGPAVAARFDYAGALHLLSGLAIDLHTLPTDRADCYRAILYAILDALRPSWLRFAISGTASVRANVPTNVCQVLRDIGLFDDELSADTRIWWDRIRALAYGERDRARIESGTLGEQLCLRREESILSFAGRPDLTGC